MSITSAERRPTLPTEAELADAIKPLAEAANLIKISSRVSDVANFKGERAPTYEEIGRIFAFVLDAEGRLGEVTDYVESLRRSLPNLDYVRLMNNDDDA